jgi:thiol-disulfide isomerase/thioredoxin
MPKKRAILRWAGEILFAIVAIFVISTAIGHFRSPSDAPKRLSDIGEEVPVSHFGGEGAIAIHFWGTWCPVCREEIDNIDSLSKRYRIVTIAVNSGDAEEIDEWMRSRNLDFPVVADENGELAKRFGVSVFPSTLFYSSDGKLLFSESGYITTPGMSVRMWLAK